MPFKLNETKDKLDKAGDGINKKTKHIDELKRIEKEFSYQNNKIIKLKNELIKKNESISTFEENIKDLENKNISLNERKKEAKDLKYQLNRINNEHEKKVEDLEHQLNNKDILFDEHKEKKIMININKKYKN